MVEFHIFSQILGRFRRKRKSELKYKHPEGPEETYAPTWVQISRDTLLGLAGEQAANS
jgi:hypothetical protein